MRDVEFGSQGGGSEHGDYGHAVHVVGDGFAVEEAHAPPAFAFGGFEAREEVEEGDGCWVVGRGWGGESGEDWGVLD